MDRGCPPPHRTPVPGPAAGLSRLPRLPRLRATFRLQVACCQHVSLFGLFFFFSLNFIMATLVNEIPCQVYSSAVRHVYIARCGPHPQLGFFLSPPI